MVEVPFYYPFNKGKSFLATFPNKEVAQCANEYCSQRNKEAFPGFYPANKLVYDFIFMFCASIKKAEEQ